MNAYSLLIDLGGTDLKFALAINDEVISDSIRRVSAPPFLDKKIRTYPHEKFIDIIRENIDFYFELENLPCKILVSGQVGSWILTDSDGTALTNLVSWQSNYSSDGAILELIYGKSFVSRSAPLEGTGAEDWFGAPWRTIPKFIQQIEKFPSQAYFHSLISWTVWELTDRSQHIIHSSDAAATGLYSIFDRKWLGDFKILGTNLKFPKVTPLFEPVGYLAKTNIPIYVGIGDQQASLYGVGILPNTFVINAGTGGQVAKLVEGDVTHKKIRPYFDGYFIETITHIPSGRYLTEFVNYLLISHGHKVEWNWILQRGISDENLPLQMPILDWNFDEFLNYLDFTSNVEVIANELVEQISRNFIEQLKLLGCSSGDVVYLAGGIGTQLKRIQQLLEVIGVKIVLTTREETTLEGLAKLSCTIN